jgi:hypothetical protein
MGGGCIFLLSHHDLQTTNSLCCLFRSREVRMTQQYGIDIAQLNTTKDSRNSDK